MARRKIRLGLAVDDRTQHMSDEALVCRRLGHKWALKGLPRKRFLELLDKGLTEDRRYCEHGCGSTWTQVWDVRTGKIVEMERKYPARGEYLLPPGSGRLHRDDARVAAFARQYTEYA